MATTKAKAVSLQILKENDKGRDTLRHVFDIISKDDSPQVLMIESWGGYNKGYASNHSSRRRAAKHLDARLRKILTKGGNIKWHLLPERNIKLQHIAADDAELMDKILEGELPTNIYDAADQHFGGSHKDELKEYSARRSFVHLHSTHDVLTVPKLFLLGAMRIIGSKTAPLIESMTQLTEFAEASPVYEGGELVGKEFMENAIAAVNDMPIIQLKPTTISEDTVVKPKPEPRDYSKWGAYA